MNNSTHSRRVLIFSIAYEPWWGGAEIAVKEITDRLGSSDFIFDMITANLSGREKRFERVGAISIYRVGWGQTAKLFFPILAFVKGARLHFSKRYSFVWSVMANYAGLAGLLFKLFYRQTPFLLTLQEGDPIDKIERRVGIFYPIFRLIFRKADHVQAISSFLADWAQSIGVTGGVSVVPNGVDLEKFQVESIKLKVDDMRMDFGFKKEDVVLVTTSRLVEKNGVGDIIKALKYLPEQVKLLIIGGGELATALLALASDCGVGDRLHFSGFVQHDNLPSYLWASDIFIRPSLSEGFGNSFIEAMAAGLPVIATPVGGIPDFLTDKETGLFCRVSDPEDIARKVNILMRDREIRDHLVLNGRRLVIEKYQWSIIAPQIKSIFDHLLS